MIIGTENCYLDNGDRSSFFIDIESGEEFRGESKRHYRLKDLMWSHGFHVGQDLFDLINSKQLFLCNVVNQCRFLYVVMSTGKIKLHYGNDQHIDISDIDTRMFMSAMEKYDGNRVVHPHPLSGVSVIMYWIQMITKIKGVEALSCFYSRNPSLGHSMSFLKRDMRVKTYQNTSKKTYTQGGSMNMHDILTKERCLNNFIDMMRFSYNYRNNIKESSNEYNPFSKTGLEIL